MNRKTEFKLVRSDSRGWLPTGKEGRPSILKNHPANAKMLTELRENPRLKPFEVCGYEVQYSDMERFARENGLRGVVGSLRRSLKSEVRRMRRDKALENVAKDYQVRVFRRGETLCVGVVNLPETPVKPQKR